MLSNKLWVVLGVLVILLLGVFGLIFYNDGEILNIFQSPLQKISTQKDSEDVQVVGDSVFVVGKIVSNFKLNESNLAETTFILTSDPNATGVKLIATSEEGTIIVGDPNRPADIPKFLPAYNVEMPYAVDPRETIKIKLTPKTGALQADIFYNQSISKLSKGDFSPLKDVNLILYTDYIEKLK